MKIEAISTEKKDFRVRCESEEYLKEFLDQFSFGVSCPQDRSSGEYHLLGLNKSQVATVRAALARHNTPAKTVPTATGSRRVALAADAEAQKLNHGQCWFASGSDVDTKSLPPEWEGELICYVYE